MTVGYIRVSRDKQSYNRQIDMLKANGVDLRNIYSEKESGRKSERAALNKMIEELQKDDIIVVAELSRISRSISDMFDIIRRVNDKGAKIKSIKESWLDTTENSPFSAFLLSLTISLCQLEADIISSRVKEGLASARTRGKKGGRPKKTTETEKALKLYFESNFDIKDICQMSGIGRTLLYTKVNEVKSKALSMSLNGVPDDEIIKTLGISQKYLDTYKNQ